MALSHNHLLELNCLAVTMCGLSALFAFVLRHWIRLAFWLVLCSANAFCIVMNHYFPFDLKPDAHGIIHHPFYGNYPAEIPCHQAMALMPHQSCKMIIELPKEGDNGLRA